MNGVAPLLEVAPGRNYDVLCVGTALVDLLSHAPVERVVELGLHPATMTLVEGAHAAQIDAGLTIERAVSGGTVANTAVGIAALGGHPAYVGATAVDSLGERYESDLVASGVRAVLQHPAAPDPHTGTGACYVIVTPDSERTMATTLGVSGLLTGDFVASTGLVGESAIVYFDAYLLDFPDSSALVAGILEAASAAGTRVCLGLADPFAVERHHGELVELVDGVDLLLGNEEEARSLTGGGSLDEALERLASKTRASVITRGPIGAVVLGPDGTTTIDAVAVGDVRDVTGAGDLFAAGVLFAAVRGDDALRAGSLGAVLASEAIGHLGARPEADLATLAKAAGLL